MTSDDLRLIPGARVLVADDHEQHVELMDSYLSAVGHDCLHAYDGEEALRRVRSDAPELLVLDVGMPRLNGFQVCERVKRHPTMRQIPVILMLDDGAMEEKLRGIEVGADDFLIKPFNKLELLTRVKSLVRVKRLNDQLDQSEAVIYTLARVIEEKDEFRQHHSERLASLATLLGQALELPPDEIETLRVAAALQNIGTVGVKESILQKRGSLTEAEYTEIKQHPVIGERICAALRCADEVGPLIRYHQERWDGQGYPDGLRGEQIPLLARVMAVADAYLALTADRAYRPALSPPEAAHILEEGAGSQWDPTLVRVFLDAVIAEELEPRMAASHS
jgi:putative two-component system response regulator